MYFISGATTANHLMALIIIINANRVGSDHTGSRSPHGPDNGTDVDHVEKKKSGEDYLQYQAHSSSVCNLRHFNFDNRWSRKVSKILSSFLFLLLLKLLKIICTL